MQKHNVKKTVKNELEKAWVKSSKIIEKKELNQPNRKQKNENGNKKINPKLATK